MFCFNSNLIFLLTLWNKWGICSILNDVTPIFLLWCRNTLLDTLMGYINNTFFLLSSGLTSSKPLENTLFQYTEANILDCWSVNVMSMTLTHSLMPIAIKKFRFSCSNSTFFLVTTKFQLLHSHTLVIFLGKL